MTKVLTVAGIDISKKFFDVCLLGAGKEQVKHFSYDKEGLRALTKWLPEGVHSVMEATGPYYLRLACYLHNQGIQVSVVNPLVIKRFSQMRLLRAKTDRADAKMIAGYAAAEQPPAAYQLKLQQLEALLQQLQKQHSALLCQREAFEVTGLMDREVKELLEKMTKHLEKQIVLIAKKMEGITQEHDGALLTNLVSIPGIGKKTAIVLIVLSNGFKKFSNYKQLSAYIGLSPRIYESGTSVKGKAKICKMGMSSIRAMLYVCTWSAKKCNKGCKELYERLLAKGKPKQVALIAVANKLLKQAFAIATNNTAYDENYLKNICF
jgi:transposase